MEPGDTVPTWRSIPERPGKGANDMAITSFTRFKSDKTGEMVKAAKQAKKIVEKHASARSIQMRSWPPRHDITDGPANEPNQRPDQNRGSYPGEVHPVSQHAGYHDGRQTDCGDRTDPIKNASQTFQHVGILAWPGRGYLQVAKVSLLP